MEPKFPDSWSALKIPQWRHELLETLKELADPVYQQKAWVEEAVDQAVIVGAQQVYHSLFEDLDLGSDPKGAVGCFLFDEAELAAIEPLIRLLEAVRNDLGKPTSRSCINHPRWSEVVGAAAAARGVLLEKGEVKGTAERLKS